MNVNEAYLRKGGTGQQLTTGDLFLVDPRSVKKSWGSSDAGADKKHESKGTWQELTIFVAAKNHQVMWLVNDTALLTLYMCRERGREKNTWSERGRTKHHV